MMAVLIRPLEPVLAQDLGKAIKEYGVVRADGVVGDREFQGQRDECECDNASRTADRVWGSSLGIRAG